LLRLKFANILVLVGGLGACQSPDPTDHEKLILGQALFEDGRFSADGKISCASCHRPEYAFADTLPRSIGAFGRETRRNTPTLWGLPTDLPLMADGGVPSLKSGSLSVLAALTAHGDMAFDPRSLNQKLKAYPRYLQLLGRLYPNTDPASAYLRTLHRYLLDLSEQGRQASIENTPLNSPLVSRGKALFEGEAGCFRCHNGEGKTDGAFYNLALGNRSKEEGRAAITLKEEDRGRLRTPVLRNLGKTAPYFYDGQAATLQVVLEHYQQGAGEAGRWLGDSLQKEALLAYLQSL
jgi:cytochrome c peroxidase